MTSPPKLTAEMVREMSDRVASALGDPTDRSGIGIEFAAAVDWIELALPVLRDYWHYHNTSPRNMRTAPDGSALKAETDALLAGFPAPQP